MIAAFTKRQVLQELSLHHGADAPEERYLDVTMARRTATARHAARDPARLPRWKGRHRGTQRTAASQSSSVGEKLSAAAGKVAARTKTSCVTERLVHAKIVRLAGIDRGIINGG